jgi:glycine/D-amino acid oxidase-like deaminating enzyme
MRVGVLGGGLQGCCVALALAERGAKAILFDRNEALLSRTAVANEGKIHLGYMYAGDPTLSTARTMMQGALAFAPFFERYLGIPLDALATSEPAAYVVHRDSQHRPQGVEAYIGAVHGLLLEAATGRERAYFGGDVRAPPRRWSPSERDGKFNAEHALAAFDTVELAVNPIELAAAVRGGIAAHPGIETRLRHNVIAADDDGELIRVTSEGPGGLSHQRFDHVVNALWDGRLALDETRGLRPGRPWLHRLKYGVSFTRPKGVTNPPSATFVCGPFGEVVSYRDGLTYLTWYPECLKGISSEISPPDWATYPSEPLRSSILEGTLTAMSHIVPSLAELQPEALPDACVKGGVIVAWGDTDIYDPESELHRRYEIGVTSAGRFHSVDPGKLTMAPLFAEICAERIRPRA